MTVIAFDGTTLAADKYVWGRRGAVGRATKIQRITDNLVGVSGSNIIVPQIFAWAKTGFTDEAMPLLQKDPAEHTEIMVITKDRRLLMYENSSVPWINERKFWAIGAGAELAIGAMAAKATAAEAVAICAEYHGNCGKGCDTLTFEEETSLWR
jgi:ATP-dependent protease HslVU (ClpYQ) peptidase subunit